ncbi:hypothetical protein [Azospira restricta]|uniref:Uncharacterized protein n=1 Tax=Azospira restricta TaxID=404405 RepID=A0A974SLR5_9RHOO|nr:hypothetical protein [Azospira restricta]QRJ62441.1 hypothetical protein IWH25_11660 [Azospira restricta]
MSATGSDVQRLLSACTSVGEIRNALNALCADFGNVLNVTVLCGNNSPQKKLCVVDLVPDDSDVQRCARHLGGRIFGYSSVILDLVPHPQFGCPRGVEAPPAIDCSCIARL